MQHDPGDEHNLDTPRHVDDGVEAPKLKGNQNVREDLSGQFAKETNAGKPGFNLETDEPKPKPYGPEVIRVLQACEGLLNEQEDYNLAAFAMDAIQAVNDLYMARHREIRGKQ